MLASKPTVSARRRAFAALSLMLVLLMARVCGQCHDAAERITKFAKTEAEWADVITDMQGRGLMADDKDIETVLAYLTGNYGPPQSTGRAGQPRTP